MRKLLLLVLVLGLACPVFAQEKAAEKKNGPVISWEKKSHDFGNIMQGDKVEHTFHFTNTGNEPLIITNVQVSCGCTVPKGWPRDPIPPGGTGQITVSFNSAGKIGMQNKPVILVTNAVNPEGNTITFTTNILDKKQPNQ
jgi:hypothetical protein